MTADTHVHEYTFASLSLRANFTLCVIIDTINEVKTRISTYASLQRKENREKLVISLVSCRSVVKNFWAIKT